MPPCSVFKQYPPKRLTASYVTLYPLLPLGANGKITPTARYRDKLKVSMYLAIDIGGTKTLIAVFNASGKVLEQVKFPTPSEYKSFLKVLEENVAKVATEKLSKAVVAVPGLLDLRSGKVVNLGNLPWHNRPIRKDISKALKGLPVIIENDARCAGLAEAKYLKSRYKKVLYLTISTGIGGALMHNGRIVSELRDTEMGKMPLVFEGNIRHWESFASGKAIVERYGKQASDIDDAKSWEEIGERVAYGVGVLCSIFQPEAIVFGGGAGKYSAHFKKPIDKYLRAHLHAIVKRPKALVTAKNKENGSIYGCFELARNYESSYTTD